MFHRIQSTEVCTGKLVGVDSYDSTFLTSLRSTIIPIQIKIRVRKSCLTDVPCLNGGTRKMKVNQNVDVLGRD